MDKILESYDKKETNSEEKVEIADTKNKIGKPEGKEAGEEGKEVFVDTRTCKYVNTKILLYVVHGADLTASLLMVS